jgi:hypothetical protein
MKNYQAILLSVAGFVIATKTMNGTLSNYITFSGVLNEMAVTLFAIMLSMIGLLSIDYKKLIKSLF